MGPTLIPLLEALAQLGVSQRTACPALGQHRSTQRKIARTADDEGALTADIVELARRYGRYGYRPITALLRHAGWSANRKRVERIWRREGLKVPANQPKHDRLWLADGSCIRLWPERSNQVWAYDFVADRTRDARKFRMLCVIDEFTREALAIRVARRLDSNHVIEVLADLCLVRGVPEHIRSDQGPEFIATAVKDWIAAVGAKTAYIEKSSPWENGYVERRPEGIILDMDSSESPHGEQEGSAWNGHFGYTCYHPLFVFNQYGDLERSLLRAGHVHSAEDWRLVLEPVIARYRERGVDLYFRADAAFAKSEIYELLEAEDIRYAIRLPANQVLQRRISHLLSRPVGRPPKKPIVSYASLHYQAAGWTRARRVVAKVEWHQGEL